jgi:adenylate cyclase
MLGPLRRTFESLVRLGARPTDTRDERLRKEALVLTAAFITVMSTLWTGTYLVLGLPVSAAVPLAYQILSMIGLAWLARSGDFNLFRLSQVTSMLVLPFILQWSLGGFVNSSAMMVWAFASPLGALVLYNPRRAMWFMLGYLGLAVVSALIDPLLSAGAPPLPDWLRLLFFLLNIATLSTVTFAILVYFVGARERAQAEAERVLNNVLPQSIADRLRAGEQRIADDYPSVTVLFADVAGFTPLARRAGAERVIAILDNVFTRFDELATRHGLEKIKTIGDAYMAVAGAPRPMPDHAAAAADMALDLLDAVQSAADELAEPLAVRVGLHTGQAMAGVIGRRKFAYDLWGDAVNVASRMESTGVPGRIQVSDAVEEELRGRYRFEERGTIEVKGLGQMSTFFLLGRA